MDEGDEYVPQISQMDYSQLGGMDTMGGGYYDQPPNMYGGAGPNAQQMDAFRHSQMSNAMGGGHPSMGGYMGPNPAMMQQMSQVNANRMAQQHAMMGAQQPGSSVPQGQTTTPSGGKQKGGSRKSKKAAAAANSGQASQSADANAGLPTHQSLPPSYQMMSPGASAHGLLQQQAQQSRMNPAFPQPNMYYSQQQQAAQRWPSASDAAQYGSAQAPVAYSNQTPQQHPNAGFPSGTTGFQPGPPAQTQQQMQSYYAAGQMKPPYYGQVPPGYPPQFNNPQSSVQQVQSVNQPQQQPHAGRYPPQNQTPQSPYFGDPSAYYAQQQAYSQGYPPSSQAAPQQSSGKMGVPSVQQPLSIPTSQHSPLLKTPSKSAL
ncbi:hypothetical protein Ddc_00221 [Ditylenchus destructor]|nr:hypothetical protein Ddc_00221 [Ditylenchus destructor]